MCSLWRLPSTVGRDNKLEMCWEVRTSDLAQQDVIKTASAVFREQLCRYTIIPLSVCRYMLPSLCKGQSAVSFLWSGEFAPPKITPPPILLRLGSEASALAIDCLGARSNIDKPVPIKVIFGESLQLCLSSVRLCLARAGRHVCLLYERYHNTSRPSFPSGLTSVFCLKSHSKYHEQRHTCANDRPAIHSPNRYFAIATSCSGWL